MDVASYSCCLQCPRECGCNRLEFATSGFCREASEIRVASACLHFGEEPPITVFGGSGTIFITGCNLRCAFCQNYQISQHGMGAVLSAKDFAEICLNLQSAGAENINIVTGSHAIPALAEGITEAKLRGLVIPICWNSSAYEKVEALRLLDGLVDIWLPDFKTVSGELSKSLFKAEDYPECAKEAILYMLEKSPLRLKTIDPPAGFTGEAREKMMGGVIVRHLFLPGRIDDTILALDWLKRNVDGRAFISLMSQYTPVSFEESAEALEKRQGALSTIANRFVSIEEFGELRDILDAYNFEYLFYQELEQDSSWLPDFDRFQPFSNELAKPVWHWKPTPTESPHPASLVKDKARGRLW